jgi:acyl phosphate:glycerol-3-phosphate acyltransferase
MFGGPPVPFAFSPDDFLGLALGYLCGSIPFGLLLTRFAGTADLRSIGSGNIGATNVLRTGRKDLAAATLVLDALKGTAAVLLAYYYLGGAAALAAAIGAFLGHLYPVWIGFRGGKGVATFLGCLIGIAWQAALVFVVAWLAVAALTRYSSAAALAASVLAPLTFYLWLGRPYAGLVFALLAALLWIKHRANIERLLKGSETRIGQRS